ncbi:MAG TPA: FkbM family methyltransferase [Sphingomicrobium sp.]|nr:FkbM family methyltransferase [Sphingomicrobium sp.]
MKIPFLISSRIRPAFLLRAVRSARKLPFGRRIVDWYDPNIIGKHIRYDFRQNLTVFESGTYKLIIDLNDHIGFRTFIEKRPFEQSVYRIAKAMNLGTNDVILDIGANIGTASIPICAEAGCELIAIEASKQNAELLLQNAALNGVRMHPHIVALTAPEEANRAVPLYLREGNSGANSLVERWSSKRDDQDCEMVSTQTLDGLALDQALMDRIRIVKVDIEGAEWGMVRGAKNFFAQNRAPVLMEYRSDAMDEGLRREFSQLIEFLLERYDICGLNKDGHEVEFDFSGSYENILFTRRSSEAGSGLKLGGMS